MYLKLINFFLFYVIEIVYRRLLRMCIKISFETKQNSIRAYYISCKFCLSNIFFWTYSLYLVKTIYFSVCFIYKFCFNKSYRCIYFILTLLYWYLHLNIYKFMSLYSFAPKQPYCKKIYKNYYFFNVNLTCWTLILVLNFHIL